MPRVRVAGRLRPTGEVSVLSCSCSAWYRRGYAETVPSTFTLETRSSHAAEQLFDLSLSIDAHLGSMSDSGERAVAGVTSGQIGLGEEVTWRARHFGIWFTMTSRIVELDRPHRFVDEQVKGPFRSFVHEHSFTPSPGVP